MKEYKIIFSESAFKDLKKLPKKNSNNIIKKLEYFEKSKNPLFFFKKLKDRTLGEYRFRIGNYRAIFDTDKNGNIIILIILSIKHRKNIYKT